MTGVQTCALPILKSNTDLDLLVQNHCMFNDNLNHHTIIDCNSQIKETQ